MRPALKWWLCMMLASLLSVASRLYKIHEPAHVCWDETHFGKMGSWYINRTLFFDVHPPLGKMLVALGGVLGGYNGSFSFSKPGDPFPDDLPYVFVRCFCAMFGAAIVPLSYSITWYLSGSLNASMLTASLIIFDTGILTLSQYILLDPFLLFFIMSSTFGYLKFQTYHNRSYSLGWWLWLSLTGICLACSVSVKFVGLFVVILLGVSTAGELWQLLGDMSRPINDFVKQFIARVLCLVVLPILIYLAIFRVHFVILSKSGKDDGFFSSAFQAQLEGNPLHNISMPKYVAYDSVVTIKNHRTGGNYLHSHWHLYPEGAGAAQQQVTAYSHKDENNEWYFRQHSEMSSNQNTVEDVVKLVRNGDLFHLEHVMTGRNLHSHKERAPLTRHHYQVTCYGQNGNGDDNDVFRIVVPGAPIGEPIKTVRSVFQLVHVNVGCALHSHDKQLPKWGWEQLEVTCNPTKKHPNNLWNVEYIFDSRLENSSFEVYRLNFLEQFQEFHAVMIRGNRGLKPKVGEFTSTPWQWPLNYRGQPFAGPDYRVYLLGNPVIWWTSFSTLIAFMIVGLIKICHNRRYMTEKSSDNSVANSSILRAGFWLVLAWAIHYFPFWTMTRILYFHHYFSAQLYSIILTAVVWDAVIEYICMYLPHLIRCWAYAVIFGALYSAIAFSFYIFSPLSYGAEGSLADSPDSVLHGLKWLESWDF